MDTPEAPTFGQVLRRLRLAAGTSQQALAEGAGLSARRISDMERGLRRTPRASTIERLARALSVAQSEFTSPDGRSEAIHNSSNELSSFVGRHEELAQLTHLLPTTRLLTLAGPGGIGKTRLGPRVASAVLADYPHGVWLVELAALANPDLVADRVAEVLAPGDREDATPIQRLVTVLRNKQLLLVLDNCEHMLAECAALVVTLLRACGGLRVLATSREPLAITGEVTWRVPSLSLPDLRLPLQHDALARSDAAQLLIARVSAQQPNFPTGQANMTAIVEVCRRLDGIPLALELAAAHVPTLGMDGVVRRLDDRFRLLVGGDRAAPTRHQTLRATIDWSYALLEQPERALLDRFSVFAGGGGLDAVESVCQGQDAAARVLESSAVLPLLERLLRSR